MDEPTKPRTVFVQGSEFYWLPDAFKSLLKIIWKILKWGLILVAAVFAWNWFDDAEPVVKISVIGFGIFMYMARKIDQLDREVKKLKQTIWAQSTGNYDRRYEDD